MLKTWIALIALVPAVSFAKTAHKTVTTTTTTTNADGIVTKKTTTSDAADTTATAAEPKAASGTLLGGTSGNGSVSSALKGLSVFAMYDFADQIEDQNNNKTNTERAVDVGVSYETSQLSQGIAAQFGVQYDFSRSTKPQGGATGAKFSEFLGFAELTAHLTTAFKLMGGINYNLPSADNLGDGVTLKGNVGYQLGGSFAFNDHIALDARYRSVQYTQQAGNTSTDFKENGITMGGRYMF